MAHLATPTLRRQTAHHHVVRAKKKHQTSLHLVDSLTAQERVRDFHQMPHLAKEDAVIERLAWAVVLGLLFIAIRLAGVL